jgi:NADPH:quinone reductase-like Zn-dependent oxidoreductase
LPAVIGHEIVGQVEELGAEFPLEGADHRPGDAVADISADKLKRVKSLLHYKLASVRGTYGSTLYQNRLAMEKNHFTCSA